MTSDQSSSPPGTWDANGETREDIRDDTGASTAPYQAFANRIERHWQELQEITLVGPPAAGRVADQEPGGQPEEQDGSRVAGQPVQRRAPRRQRHRRAVDGIPGSRHWSFAKSSELEPQRVWR